MTLYVRTPVITITWLNVATPVAITRVLEASTSWGLDLAVSEASFTVPTRDDLHGATYFSYVAITLTYSSIPDDGFGVGHGTKPIWQGFVVGFSDAYYPRGVIVHCKGPLVLCQLQENPAYSDGGGTSPTLGGTLLVPSDGSGTTDDAIILALLTASSADTLAGGIEPTGPIVSGVKTPRKVGTVAPLQFIWGERETALSVIQRLDEISASDVDGTWLLLRTYDDKDGSIRRRHLDMVPAGSAVATFTEERDIFDGGAERDVLAAKNRIAVTGYDKGDGAGAVNYTVSVANAYLTRASYITQALSSSMIEVQTEADVVSNVGISCEGVANALLRIWATVQERTTYTTPLDRDVDLAATIAIATPGGTTERLGNSGSSTKFWVQRYTRRVDPEGTFAIDYTVLRGAG